MKVAHRHSERDLRIIPFTYPKFIFRKIKCLYVDQINTKKQIIKSVIVITISKKHNYFSYTSYDSILNHMKAIIITLTTDSDNFRLIIDYYS